ncbi:unnamed protein product [Scytosiphon promiscuus]
MRCVLVSCCGLPAAGKTTFCRSLVADASATTSFAASPADARLPRDSVTEGGAQVRVSHVCFDEYIDRARLRAELGSSDYKKPQTPGPHPSRTGLLCPRGKTPRERRGTGKIGSERGDSRGCDRGSGDERDSRNGLRAVSPVCRNRDTEVVVSATQGVSADGSSTRCAIAKSQASESARAASLEGGEHGAGWWWHEGRRAAMAEIEALAAALQVRGGSPATTGSGSECQSRQAQAPSPSTLTKKTVSTASEERGEAVERVFCAEEVAMHHPAGDPVAPGDRLSRAGASSGVHVVLADDNMHFRSMRHEVWRLARKFGCGYAQIYFPTNADMAVERDKTRGVPVTEAVIRKMAASIQPPDPERFGWERHTAVVDSATPECPLPQNYSAHLARTIGEGPRQTPDRCGRTSCDTGQGHDLKDRDSENTRGGSPTHSFWRAIAAAAAEDPTPFSSPACSAASLLEKEADRAVTRASLLHQIDLELREVVKRVAKEAASAGLQRNIHRQVMGACTASKKMVMSDLRPAGTQCRSRPSNRNTPRGRAIKKDRDGSFPASVQDDDESDCTIAKSVRDRCPSSSCPPHVERFLSEFEKALCVVHGLKFSSVKDLLAAAGTLDKAVVHQV